MLLAAQRKHKAATHARFQVSAVAQQRPSLFWNVTQTRFDSWLPGHCAGLFFKVQAVKEDS
jgi:hypothetical protein